MTSLTQPAIAPLRFDARLAAFLRGQLSRRESDKFLDMLRADPELRDRAVATARLARALGEIGRETDQEVIDALTSTTMPRVEAIADAAAGPPAVVVRRRRILAAVIFLALIALVIAGIAAHRRHEIERLAALGHEHITFTTSPDLSRGIDTPFDPSLAPLYSDIKHSSDLSATIAELEDLWAQSLSYEFNARTTSMPEIGWMLANAYLIHGDAPSAVTILDRLANEYPPGSAMGDRSRALRALILD